MDDVLNPVRERRVARIPLLSRLVHLEIPEVWVRFLLAIVGLVLAFAAALFSTVTRESGNLWGTLILASVALLLAIFVGLTTVPYLARRIATARIRNAFEYDVTRVGIVYVAVVVLIGIAALNTGNNLLYIVVAALLSAILVSGVVSALVLRDLCLDIRVPEDVFAELPVLARIILQNPRRWLPSFSINVIAVNREKSAKRWRWTPATFGFPPWRRPADQWIQLPDRRLRRIAASASAPGIFQGPAYFPHIPAGTELTADLDLLFARRGCYRQETFGLATRFPFAFLTKTRRLALPREITVYPPVTPTDQFFEVLPLITGELETFVRGRGSDLYRIREYLPEDSARHVDWKATAKSGSLKVREFSREDERRLRIVFDNPGSGMVSAQAYEGAVALAASLGWYFAAEDAEVSFASQGYSGGTDIHRFLAHLAVVEPRTSPSMIDELPVSVDYNIIFTACPRGTIPAALWACSYFIFMADRSSAAPLNSR
jgi:uncharacterized protein (DUF58 family)